jgi:putative transposase
MSKNRFSEEQILGVSKEAQAGVPVKELCRRVGVSNATFLPLEGRVLELAAGTARGADARRSCARAGTPEL